VAQVGPVEGTENLEQETEHAKPENTREPGRVKRNIGEEG